MKTDREKDSADPDRNGLEAGVADNNQERGELIKRTGNKNDLGILTPDSSYYLQFCNILSSNAFSYHL